MDQNSSLNSRASDLAPPLLSSYQFNWWALSTPFICDSGHWTPLYSNSYGTLSSLLVFLLGQRLLSLEIVIQASDLYKFFEPRVQEPAMQHTEWFWTPILRAFFQELKASLRYLSRRLLDACFHLETEIEACSLPWLTMAEKIWDLIPSSL